jgi:hypothetical protein
LEARIEIAVADENFDVAAKLEEDIQSARADIEALGFSVSELDEALANTVVPSSFVDGESQDRGIGNVEDNDEAIVKHGVDEECTVDVDVEETKLNDKCKTEEDEDEDEDEGGKEEKEDAGM